MKKIVYKVSNVKKKKKLFILVQMENGQYWTKLKKKVYKLKQKFSVKIIKKKTKNLVSNWKKKMKT